ncbi:uncharacterized protein LOC135824560 [Sycon ciliatum]|uniref:uncharacterized protein LOC135824560 n=1 Tax=Sycon ciliatum TaxID=27933 RepID=UPI0031F6E658
MTEQTPPAWPKWQVGAAVGAGIAVAATAGYLLYRSRRSDVDDDTPQSPSTASKDNTSSVGVSGSTAEDVRATVAAGGPGQKDASASSAATPKAPEPEDFQKCKSAGNALYREGNYTAAIEAYREGLMKCPEDQRVQRSIFYQNIAATYERIAEGATVEATRTEAWTEVKDSCTQALALNDKYTKAYTRRARSNYILTDYSAALDDITAANLLETSSNPSDPRPSDQVMQLATRVLKELGEKKAVELHDKRPPIKVSKNFIRTYLDSFYFDLGKFYDVSDDLIAECLAESERELDVIALSADGTDFSGDDNEKLPVSRDNIGYRTRHPAAAAAAATTTEEVAEPSTASSDTPDGAAEEKTNGDECTSAEQPAENLAEGTETSEEATATEEESTPAADAAPEADADKADSETATTEAVKEVANGDGEKANGEDAETTETESTEAEKTEAAEQPEPEEGEVVESEPAAEESQEASSTTAEEEEEKKEDTKEDALRMEGSRLYLRAVLKYKNGQYPLAQQACRRAMLFASDDEGYFSKTQLAQLHLIAASVNQMYSRFDDAMVDLAVVISMDGVAPNELLSHALIKRGSQYLVLGRTDEGLLDFQRAGAATPNNADVFHHRGQMHALMNHMAEAMADYQEAVKLAPDWAAAAVQQAYAMYKMATMTGDGRLLQQTMQCFEDIRSKFPDYAEGLYMYGQVSADAGNLSETERLYAAARKADPENVSVRVHEALLVLQREHDFDKTLEQLNAALTIDPYSDFVYETMAQLEVQRHNIDRAVEYWDQALLLVRTRIEMVHLFSIREATIAQAKMCKHLGIDLAEIGPEMF